MPEVLSPTDWGARVDYDLWTDPYTPDEGVVIHHGGGGDYPAAQHPFSRTKEMSQLRSWEAFHIDGRGWRGLAYGWGIGQTGTIYRIRGFNRYGAHLGDIDGDGIANNEELIPIIWILSGLIHRSSEAMQDSTEWLRREVIEPKAPKARQLYGHREVQDKPTICPGPLSMVYVESHRFLETSLPPIGEDMSPQDWTTKDWEAFDNHVWSAKFGRGDNRELAGSVLVQARNYSKADFLNGDTGITKDELVAAIADAIEEADITGAMADELARRLVE